MPPVESILRTPDGLTLVGEHHLRPDPRARADVVLLHGYAEHAGRYAELIAALGAAGFSCHLLELRGHGRSEGVRGYVDRFGDYLDDLDLFLQRLDEIQTPGPAVPRILLGHSLGGLISLAYVLRRPDAFAALAVSSPFLYPAIEAPALKVWLASLLSRLAPTRLMKSEIASRWLSHDPAIVAAYDRDPLVFKTLSPHWFFEIRQAQDDLLARAGEIRPPALFLLGDADRIADPARSRQVFERLGSTEKQLVAYPGFFHEILNEIERARVVRDLLGWLDQRTGNDV